MCRLSFQIIKRKCFGIKHTVMKFMSANVFLYYCIAAQLVPRMY